jgi:DNA processing protein
VSSDPDQQRLARAALTYLAEPGDRLLGALLSACEPGALVEGIKAGRVPEEALAVASRRLAAIDRGMDHWRARLAEVPDERDLAAFDRDGIRLTCPGDPEWPTQLDVLGDMRPYALWLRGDADLRYSCLRSVSVVGARAATAYGSHVSAEISAALAGRGWTVLSGGAYGVDAAAHRGALAADGVTVAVLACGVDQPYPPGNHELFEAIAAQGVLASEWPPGRNPTRLRFLVRNRVIAALSRGTVVVEAAMRSGALNTARYARDLCRPLMAVPGPVTSEMSAGCHWTMREWDAVCVTGASDVLEEVTAVGESELDVTGGPVVARAELDPLTLRVLEAVPARGGAGPATIAVTAGVDVDTAVGCLGSLAAGGFVQRGLRGWRLASQVPRTAAPSMLD